MTMTATAKRREAPGASMRKRLWWPLTPYGLAQGAREDVQAWIPDAIKHGAKDGDVISFRTEQVADRFELHVRADAMYTTPGVIRHIDGTVYVSEDGECADTLDGLVASLAAQPAWMLPADYQVRVVWPCPDVDYRLIDDGGAMQFVRVRGGR
jgi:hypothetical protein